MYSTTDSEMLIIYMSYMSFRTLPVSFGYTEMEITERRGCVVTVRSCLNQSILSQTCQNFEVASWHQCLADQEVGFWKKRKKRLDSSLEADHVYNHTRLKVKFLYIHIKICFSLWPESSCFSKFVTQLK